MASASTAPQHRVVAAVAAHGAEPAQIDTSLRVPVLFSIAAGLLWLFVAIAFGLASSFKLQNPEFLANCEWLTYGRVTPAATNALFYGWGVNAAVAASLWIFARLSGSTLRYGNLLLVAALFWNLGVTVGIGGILYGDSSGIEGLEMPKYVGPFLLISFALMTVWLLDVFRNRRYSHVYISQGYILGAMFWFPWVFAVAQLMLNFVPVRGTVQSIVNAWYVHNLLTLWFGSVGLAAIYYLLPKVTGKAIDAYYLAPLGFWSYALCNSWMGTQRLLGAPVPAWVQAAGAASAFMAIVPLMIISINLFGSFKAGWSAVKESAALKFCAFALLSYLVSSLLTIILSVPSWAAGLSLTLFAESQVHLTFVGFFTMAAFGAIYFFAPRLTLKAWPSAGLIKAHLWLSILGTLVIFFALAAGGAKQGSELANAGRPVLQIVQDLNSYFLMHAVGLGLLGLGQVAFLVNFVKLLTAKRAPNVSASTLFRSAPQMEVTA